MGVTGGEGKEKGSRVQPQTRRLIGTGSLRGRTKYPKAPGLEGREGRKSPGGNNRFDNLAADFVNTRNAPLTGHASPAKRTLHRRLGIGRQRNPVGTERELERA